MTYNDVYKKFMIEYDKADISSSYPSLTIYEVATILDKALLALIAQKVSGNNARKTVLDQDIKSSSDIQKLLTTSSITGSGNITDGDFLNEKLISMPPDLLYLIKTYIKYSNYSKVAQVTSQIYADKYRVTSSNKPWLKNPFCFLEDDKIHILEDYGIEDYINGSFVAVPYYIKRPNMFSDAKDKALSINSSEQLPLSDAACEELISLAIIYAWKTVESPRISTEIQTKPLEA